MNKKPFRIARSHTGLGLFATAPIRKRTLIVEYSGRRILTRTAKQKERLGANKYLFEINSHWTIDGSSRRNLARYVNHSCRPNAEAVLVRKRMMYRARRSIRQDEEITVDYGREYFKLYLKAAGCQCRWCRQKRRDKRRDTRRLAHRRRLRNRKRLQSASRSPKMARKPRRTS